MSRDSDIDIEFENMLRSDEPTLTGATCAADPLVTLISAGRAVAEPPVASSVAQSHLESMMAVARSLPTTEAARSGLSGRFKIGMAAFVASVGIGSGALAGALPGPVQRAVASAAQVVGVSLPKGAAEPHLVSSTSDTPAQPRTAGDPPAGDAGADNDGGPSIDGTANERDASGSDAAVETQREADAGEADAVGSSDNTDGDDQAPGSATAVGSDTEATSDSSSDDSGTDADLSAQSSDQNSADDTAAVTSKGSGESTESEDGASSPMTVSTYQSGATVKAPLSTDSDSDETDAVSTTVRPTPTTDSEATSDANDATDGSGSGQSSGSSD